MKLVLASTSVYRRELLARLRIPFEVHPPQVDEAQLKRELGATLQEPAALAAGLARAKAASLVARFPHAVMLASDQIAICQGRQLSKPGTAAAAREQLAYLSGRAHELVTAAVLWGSGEWQEHVDVTTLHMRNLSLAEIERYVAVENPVDCAGAYKLESLGIALFASITSHDHTAITGLPLLAVCRMLRTAGFEAP